MLDRLNEEIFEMKKSLREYRKLKSLRDSIQKELTSLVKLRGDLLDQHDKELGDVEDLERIGVKSLFLSITGKKEESLDKEKEELLRAKARYEECQTNIEDLKKDLAEAEKLLAEFGDIEGNYLRLLKEKEKLLIQSGSPQGRALGEKLIRADDLEVDIREVEEAIAAGRSTLESLKGVREKLDSAKGWGTWDLLGGGLISTIAKHSAIDEANSRAREVQHQLKTFRKELSDVNEFTEIEVNISAFASFADFFLDGLIADWFVQSRINESIGYVEEASGSIESIVRDLEKRLSGLKKELQTTRDEIGEFLQG
jgi:DNA repair exonuclease SbcCD ATPase subunit